MVGFDLLQGVLRQTQSQEPQRLGRKEWRVCQRTKSRPIIIKRRQYSLLIMGKYKLFHQLTNGKPSSCLWNLSPIQTGD